TGRKSKPAAPRRAGQKLLREAKDFVLPELVKHTDNGDLSVSIAPSTDAVQVEQISRLAECGEEIAPNFSDLPYAEQQLEKRRYLDYLKRVPKREIQRAIRREDLETWRRGGDEAESNFLTWWERKQWRKRSALLRKANRLANCGVSGRRLDCSGHAGHQFYARFKCQSRYCRGCGADVFAELFGSYVGLWLTVLRLLPPRGFRSSTIIAQLDFTAVNLERMPLRAEIREFNQDIRECMKRVCCEMGLGADGYGFLWCDEFGGWNPKKNSYNTNLHAHGVYVGPYIPQELIAKHRAEIRSEKDGAKVVWISKQKIDHAPGDFHEGECRRFIRALGHALRYTGKHVSRRIVGDVAPGPGTLPHHAKRCHEVANRLRVAVTFRNKCLQSLAIQVLKGAAAQLGQQPPPQLALDSALCTWFVLGNDHTSSAACKFRKRGRRPCPDLYGRLMVPSGAPRVADLDLGNAVINVQQSVWRGQIQTVKSR